MGPRWTLADLLLASLVVLQALHLMALQVVAMARLVKVHTMSKLGQVTVGLVKKI